VRQEHQTGGVGTRRRQRERDDAAEEEVGHLNENARAVTRVGLATAGPPVLQIDQDTQRLLDDVVRPLAFLVHDEADAAGVTFVPRVVQTLL
jgi:hypothetical protein